MKFLLAFLLSVSTVSAFAHQHGYWRHGGGGNWNWVAPVVVGGVIGYEIARPPTVVYQQPPVVIQQPAQMQNCSPWTQVQNPDGSITTTRTCQ
jgi:hypothetical protein